MTRRPPPPLPAVPAVPDAQRAITDPAELEALYGRPGRAASIKAVDRLTPAYRRWIEAAPFCILSTLGPDGPDSSPRGDDGPVVRVLDDRTLALPDWRGNRRLDSLRNILRNGQIALLFLVPGAAHVMRLRGRAWLTDDPVLRGSFRQGGETPVTVVLVSVASVQVQRTRAVTRARLWAGEDRAAGLPGIEDMLAEIEARLASEGSA